MTSLRATQRTERHALGVAILLDHDISGRAVFTGRRTDLVANRTHTLSRLLAQLNWLLPREWALDLTIAGPLVLLTGYQIPAALRRTGGRGSVTWLRNRKVP